MEDVEKLDTAIEALNEMVEMLRELNNGLMDAMGIKK